jgi:hypothetical protein
MSVHPDIESRRVRHLNEHDVLVLIEQAVNVRIGDLGVIRRGIGIAAPWRARILRWRLTIYRYDARKCAHHRQQGADRPNSHLSEIYHKRLYQANKVSVAGPSDRPRYGNSLDSLIESSHVLFSNGIRH